MANKEVLTREERALIRKELDRGVPATVIARETGIYVGTIRNARYRNYRSDLYASYESDDDDRASD